MRRLDLGEALRSAMSASRQDFSGGVEIELYVNGNQVTGRYSGSGGIATVEFSGTRIGTNCQLFDRHSGAAITAECSAHRFAGTVTSARAERNRFQIHLDSQTTRFVDSAQEEREQAAALRAAAEQERQLAEASARGQRPSARTAAKPRVAPATAPRQMARNADGSISITEAGLGISLNELMDRVVYADSQSWMANRYARGSMHNAHYEQTNRSHTTYTARGEYTFAGFMGGGIGWVRIRVNNGHLQCLEFHDQAGSCRPLYASLSQQAVAGIAVGMAQDTLRGDSSGPGSGGSREDPGYDSFEQSQARERAANTPEPPPPPPAPAINPFYCPGGTPC